MQPPACHAGSQHPIPLAHLRVHGCVNGRRVEQPEYRLETGNQGRHTRNLYGDGTILKYSRSVTPHLRAEDCMTHVHTYTNFLLSIPSPCCSAPALNVDDTGSMTEYTERETEAKNRTGSFCSCKRSLQVQESTSTCRVVIVPKHTCHFS